MCFLALFRKNKFFINNSVEAQIHFNEDHLGLWKLQVPLEWERWGGGGGGRSSETKKMGLSPRVGTAGQALAGGQLWLGGNSC